MTRKIQEPDEPVPENTVRLTLNGSLMFTRRSMLMQSITQWCSEQGWTGEDVVLMYDPVPHWASPRACIDARFSDSDKAMIFKLFWSEYI